jgi:hypothetical protein
VGEMADIVTDWYERGQEDVLAEASADPKVWVTRDGQVLRIHELGDRHLINIIHFLRAGWPCGRQSFKLKTLVAEAWLRRLPLPHILGL